MNKKDIIRKLRKYKFNPKEYCVIAGSALVMHGIRETTNDIDISCSSKMADELEKNNPYTLTESGNRRFKIEDIEIFENWGWGKSELIEGLPVTTINEIIKLKKSLGREKDIKDLKLIKNYRRNIMKACCGTDCNKCPNKGKCGGCNKCKGKPFNGECIAYNIITKKDKKAFDVLKNKLINEINNLNIKGLHVDDLNLLIGAYVNLEYKLDNKTKVKFLNDNDIYLGNQICINESKCYGVVCNEKMIIVCTYKENGSNPKLVLYKNR